MTPESRTPPQPMETILVVEDEVLVRIVIAQYLRDCGYRVIETVNADEAIAVLKLADIVVDVIFTDIDMPGAWTDSASPAGRAPIVQAPKSSSPARSPRAVNAAADLCEQNRTVPKPYEPQVVHDRIRRLLAARPPKKP